MARTTTRTVTALVLLTLAVAATAEESLSDQAAADSTQHDLPQPQPQPNYHYRYAVASRKTGDVKGAWEKRAGEDVWGAYFLRDPDGRWRTVHYEADGTGFYATVQRRPLYRRGKLAEQQGELHGTNTVLPLDDATWKSALAAAKQSAREDNHPALQKARLAGGIESAASVAPYSTTRAPGFGFSSPAASVAAYSTTRAPGFGFSGRAASSHPSTRAPGFDFPRSPNFAKQLHRPPREQSTLGGSVYSASYRSQPLRANRTPPSYSSAYASHTVQQQQMEEDADETTTIMPSTDSNQEEADESQQAPTKTSEDADSVRQHQEDESSNEAAQDDDEDDVKHRDEESGAEDSEHNPDDDHEIVPEQALQGSQLRNDHEALQVAPQLRAPQLHVHRLQGARQLQSPQADTSMDHLLGPAWSLVSSHSSLFDGQDFPLFGRGQDLRSEETPQDTQNVATWTQRADRAKGRRGAAQSTPSQGQSDAGHGRPRGGSGYERGGGRFSGSSRGGASFGSGDRLRASADPSVKDAAAPSTEATGSFGSKVRGKEDPSYQQTPAAPSKRGKNANRGPVLFAQQVEASTPAGDRRPPPRGYALPQDAQAAWLQPRPQAQQRQRPASYSGWVPVTASLQAADSYRDPAPGRARSPRGRRRAPSKQHALKDSPGALWKQPWF